MHSPREGNYDPIIIIHCSHCAHLTAWNPTIGGCGPSYTIDDLGTLGGTNSFGAAINAAGSVTGVSWLTSSAHAGGVHAFRHVDGIGMIDLGVLPNPAGTNFSFGYGINSFGQIVGGSYAAEAGTAIRAMMATATGLIDLGALSNADDASVAFDINDRGQVTGWSFNRAGERHAFVWMAAAGMRDIGTFTAADNRSMRADKSRARARPALAQHYCSASLKAPE